jgi:hypothetical protein
MVNQRLHCGHLTYTNTPLLRPGLLFTRLPSPWRGRIQVKEATASFPPLPDADEGKLTMSSPLQEVPANFSAS